MKQEKLHGVMCLVQRLTVYDRIFGIFSVALTAIFGNGDVRSVQKIHNPMFKCFCILKFLLLQELRNFNKTKMSLNVSRTLEMSGKEGLNVEDIYFVHFY